MIQSVEQSNKSKLWGFIQLLSSHNSGSVLVDDGINKTPFSYNTPHLQEQHSFSLSRFRLGLRGSLDEENRINYFFLSEFGENGITKPLGEPKNNYITDASLTFKQLPLLVKVGKFRYPGSEEGMIAQHASPFINFTTVSDQLMLERYLDSKNSTSSYVAALLQGVGAYRDSGIEIFRELTLLPKASVMLSYMLGNGSGLAHENIHAAKYTHYGYLAYEQILGGGKAYFLESFKFFGWYQKGERLLYTPLKKEFHARERYGVGATYFYKGLRFAFEYMQGSGMIYNGAKDRDPHAKNEAWRYEILASSQNRAKGYYLLSSYNLVDSLDLLLRYDYYDRAYNSKALRREFENKLVGFSYRINKDNRVDFNYTLQDIQAPHNPKVQRVLDAIDSTYALQYTMLFR